MLSSQPSRARRLVTTNSWAEGVPSSLGKEANQGAELLEAKGLPPGIVGGMPLQ